MTPDPSRSTFRFEKLRVNATLTLAGGETVSGCFFVADSASHDGCERIAEVLVRVRFPQPRPAFAVPGRLATTPARALSGAAGVRGPPRA